MGAVREASGVRHAGSRLRLCRNPQRRLCRSCTGRHTVGEVSKQDTRPGSRASSSSHPQLGRRRRIRQSALTRRGWRSYKGSHRRRGRAKNKAIQKKACRCICIAVEHLPVYKPSWFTSSIWLRTRQGRCSTRVNWCCLARSKGGDKRCVADGRHVCTC